MKFAGDSDDDDEDENDADDNQEENDEEDDDEEEEEEKETDESGISQFYIFYLLRNEWERKLVKKIKLICLWSHTSETIWFLQDIFLMYHVLGPYLYHIIICLWS